MYVFPAKRVQNSGKCCYPDVFRVVDVVLSVPVEVEAEDGRAPRVVGLHRDQGDQRRRLTSHLHFNGEESKC